MKYVAVGFKVNTSRSIFYVKADTLVSLLTKLGLKILDKDPDFVSLRMIKET